MEQKAFKNSKQWQEYQTCLLQVKILICFQTFFIFSTLQTLDICVNV